MAYVLGFIFADGHLIEAPYMRGAYVCVTNTDLDRIQTIRKLLRSEHHVRTLHKGRNFKAVYQLRIGSKKLYAQLTQYGLTPHKSLTMRFPIIPKRYQSSFIRGYFDGDGCVHLERTASGSVKKLLTVFTCGSKPFLESLHDILVQETGVKGRGLYRHGSVETAHQLRYPTRDSLRLFLFLYNPVPSKDLFLRRKYDIFKQYLEMRGLSPERIPLVLEQKGPVAN
jgi:hypothetical protein